MTQTRTQPPGRAPAGLAAALLLSLCMCGDIAYIDPQLQDLAGPGAVDCGSPRSNLSEARSAHDCAVAALRDRKPFYTSVGYLGGDGGTDIGWASSGERHFHLRVDSTDMGCTYSDVEVSNCADIAADTGGCDLLEELCLRCVVKPVK